nr:ParB N-terminal domain-containing protein [Candidatus Accumulibacter phosphatis]
MTLSADCVLLSGHRRLAAAKYLGLRTVPVRVVDALFNSLTGTERLATLRRYNQQREKSPSERIREKLLAIDPKKAHIALLRRRIEDHAMAGAVESNVKLGNSKKARTDNNHAISRFCETHHPREQAILATDGQASPLSALK